MRKYVLVTGIEPFGDFTANSSEDVARKLSGSIINDYNIIGLTIPYDSRRVKENLLDRIKGIKPELVIMLGQAFSPEQRITLESLARNYVDYTKEDLYDNTGYQPPTGEIVPSTPKELKTQIPVRELEETLSEMGFNTTTSTNCGTNFCNETYYHTLLGEYQAMFVHLPPYSSEQSKEFERGMMTKAIFSIIDELTKQ